MNDSIIEAALLLFVRVSSFMAFLPLFSGTRVPRTVKVGLAVALTVAMVFRFVPGTSLQLSQQGETSWLLFGWRILRETALGAALGWLLGLVFIPIKIAGAFIAQEMGLTIATLTSATGDASSNVLSEVLDALAVLLFLSMNGHHLFIQSLARSLELFPIGSAWLLPEGLELASTISNVSTVGVHLAAPVTTLLLGTTVALLFMMRQTPQFNLFNFGMPVRLLVGMGALVLLIPDLITRITHLFERWAGLF